MGPRHLVLGLALLAMFAAFAVTMSNEAEAAAPEKRDFFGTVLSVDGDTVTIETDEGPVDVIVGSDTKVRLPHKSDAGSADLLEGDSVAVSVDDDGETAGKIFVIPGKTQFRHVPGKVLAAPDGPTGTVTIQLPGEDAESFSFDIGDDTKLKLRHGATELAEGLFVVVLAKRDASGEISSKAVEINVAAGKRGDRGRPEPPETQDDDGDGVEDENEASVRGVFEGVDSRGRWLIGGTAVAVDRRSAVANGIVTGAVVEVEGRLSADGSLIAREIEAEDRQHRNRGRSRNRRGHIEGVFEGRDADGNWIVSGRKVVVDQRTDTDGEPRVGRRIRVDALISEDGRMRAREIENRIMAHARDRVQDELHRLESRLRGVFEGLDSEGNWKVNGVSIAVDEETRLEGTPAVGRRVDVRAFLRDGKIIASRIEGERDEADGEAADRAKREAVLSGLVERVEADGSLVINGHHVAISALSDVDGDFQRGARVRVRAVLDDDGELVAEDVDEDRSGPSRSDRPGQARGRDRVSIEGTVQRVNDDGTVLINGIPVLIKPLQAPLSSLGSDDREVSDRARRALQLLKEGLVLEIEGVMRPDGVVVATDLKADRRHREDAPERSKLSGVVERVIERDGKIIAVVVNGREIRVETLTHLEGGRLRTGARVEIDGVVRGERVIAAEIEADHEVGNNIRRRHALFHEEVEARHAQAHREIAHRHAEVHEEIEHRHARMHDELEAAHKRFHAERREMDAETHERLHKDLDRRHEEAHREMEAKHEEAHKRLEDGHEDAHREMEAKHEEVHELIEAGLEVHYSDDADDAGDIHHDDDNDGTEDIHHDDDNDGTEDLHHDDGTDDGSVDAAGHESGDEPATSDDQSDSTVADVEGVKFTTEGSIAKFSDNEFVLEDGRVFIIDVNTRFDDLLEIGAKVEIDALETRDGLIAERVTVISYLETSTDNVLKDGSLNDSSSYGTDLNSLTPSD